MKQSKESTITDLISLMARSRDPQACYTGNLREDIKRIIENSDFVSAPTSKDLESGKGESVTQAELEAKIRRRIEREKRIAELRSKLTMPGALQTWQPEVPGLYMELFNLSLEQLKDELESK